MYFRFLLIPLLAIAFTSCRQATNQLSTYYSYDLFLHPQDQVRIDLKRSFDSIAPPRPDALMVLDSGWQFVAGDVSEGLTVKAVKKGEMLLNLPHRLVLPDQSLWYSKKMEAPSKGILHVQADDGAQLFVNGKQIERMESNYFALDSGKIDISIRVLNNAMAGGLRAVSFIEEGEMLRYKKNMDLYLRLKHVVEKAMLKRFVSPAQLKLVKHAMALQKEAALRDAEVAFDDCPYLVGPWLLKRDSSSYQLMLQAESSHEVTLRYGTTANLLTESQTDRGDVLSFVIKEQAGERIFYQFTSGKTVSPVYHFDTREKENFYFNIWADSQGGWEKFQQNIANASAIDDAFGIGAGDLVNNGSDAEEWRAFFNVLSASSPYRPYYLVPGNHDHDGYYDDLVPKLYHRFTHELTPGYFGWTYGNCAFIALNPNRSFPIGVANDEAQHAWLQKQIESEGWKRATWRFVLLHQAIYSQGWKGYHGDLALRDLLEAIMESAKVDFVISGHTHDYERLEKTYGSQRTTYLIVGGAGGSLEPEVSSSYPEMDTVIKVHHMGRFRVDGDQIQFEAFDSENKRIDFFKQLKSDLHQR